MDLVLRSSSSSAQYITESMLEYGSNLLNLDLLNLNLVYAGILVVLVGMPTRVLVVVLFYIKVPSGST